MSEPQLMPKPAADHQRSEPSATEPEHDQPVAQVPVAGLSVPGRIGPDDPRSEQLSEHLRGPHRETKVELRTLRALQKVSPVRKGPGSKFSKFVQERQRRGSDYDPLGPVTAERARREAKGKLDKLEQELAAEIRSARAAGGTDPDLIEFDGRFAEQEWVEALAALDRIRTRSQAALADAHAGLRALNPDLKRIAGATKCHQPPQLAECRKAAWTAHQSKDWLMVGPQLSVLQQLAAQAIGFIDRVAEVRRRVGALKAPSQVSSMTAFLVSHEAMSWQAVVDTAPDAGREGSLAHLEGQIEHFEKPFGDRVQAQSVAQNLASGIATAEHDAEVERAEKEHTSGVDAVPTVKVKVKRGPGPKKPTVKEQKALDARAAQLETLDENLSSAKAKAQVERDRRETGLLGSFTAVANSPSGKRLDDGVLSWVITTSEGKPAVAQSLADVAALGGMGLAASIAQLPNVTAVADACVALLTAGFPAEHVLAAALLVLKAKAAVQPWLLALAVDKVPSALAFAGQHETALGIVVKVQPVLDVGEDAGELVDALAKLKTPAADIDWLLGLATVPGGPGFAVLCRAVRNYEIPVKAVRALHQAAGGRFTLDEVASIVRDHRASIAVATAAIAEADAHAVSYVELVVGIGATPPPMLKIAIRAESLLRDAGRCPGGFRARTARSDRAYIGGQAYQQANEQNDARTGFITLTFPGGSTAEVHTHWNARKKSIGKISSMHVQEATADGSAKNGIELDDWKQIFKRLPQAIVSAHNAATGTLSPTGGPLSLP